MADSRLRQLGREGPGQAVRLLQERVRVGELTPGHVSWAARLGHPIASQLDGDAGLDGSDAAVLRCLRDDLLDTEQRHRFAVRCVQRIVPLFARSLPAEMVPLTLNAIGRGPSLALDLASVLPNLPPLPRQRSAAVYQCYRALRAALDGDAQVAAQSALFARPAEDQPDELAWQRQELSQLLLE